MTAYHILRRKGSDVYSVAPTASLADAAVRLRRHGVGALVVLDGPALVGVVSERDLVRAVAEQGAAALAVPVSDVMTAPVETCGLDTEVRALMARMTARRIRHLPVVEAGLVVGVVSIGDVVKSRVLEVEGEAAVLQDALTVRWATALVA